MRPASRLVWSLAAPAAVALAVLVRSAPPDARPAGTDASEFSAARALETVRALGGDGAPRPVGSAAGDLTVELLVRRLREVGLETSVQERFACGPYGTCALVRNVMARLGPPVPGRRAVLVLAHHDSVGAGPGASDDLAGAAAAVEVARALAGGPPLPRPVIVLVTGGEEAALVGAAAFVRGHPAAREVGAAVNLEARGTTGPSILFDTSGAPAWLPAALAALPRPVTTSVAPALYQLLPNDTDLTVFDQAGIPGVNLAFAFGAVRYHTPRDDVAHLDPRSLQHHGDNALALVRALAGQDLERGGPGAPRAWFDVASAAVVSWPYPREVALVAAAAALLAALAAVRREARPLRAAALGLASALAAPLLAAAVTAVLLLALRGVGAVPRQFVADPRALEAAGWLAGAAGALLAPWLLGRGAGRSGLLAGSGVLFAALSAALGLTLPLATPVATVPALAFAASVALRGSAALRGRLAFVVDTLPSAAAALVLAPLALYLPELLGAAAVAASAFLVALALTPAAAAAFDAARPERGSAAGAGLAALGAAAVLAVVQAARPHATVDAPERLTFTFLEADGEARWLAEAEHDALPPAIRAAAPFSATRARPFPWTPTRAAFSAPAAPERLPPPRVEVLSSRASAGVRHVVARISSPRGAPVVALFLPPNVDVAAVSLEGFPLAEPPPLARWFWGGHRLVASMTTPARGVTVELSIRGEAAAIVPVADQSRGLPASGAALAAARPPTAVPFWDGDVTVATTTARF